MNIDRYVHTIAGAMILASRFQVESTYVDTSDLENLRRAMKPNTKLVYVESPSNPAMSVTDIQAAAEIAHAAGALLVVDNTFASPWA